MSGGVPADAEFYYAEVKTMKKIVFALALLLVTVMLLAPVSAFAEQSPSKAAEPEDPLVGAWRMPESPYGDDFTVFVVLNADGSFGNVTNLYESGKSGPYTQSITGNETFRWVRTGDASIELHYSYLDDNGEFVTSLSYKEEDDSLYFGEMLYAERDDSFVLLEKDGLKG